MALVPVEGVAGDRITRQQRDIHRLLAGIELGMLRLVERTEHEVEEPIEVAGEPDFLAELLEDVVGEAGADAEGHAVQQAAIAVFVLVLRRLLDIARHRRKGEGIGDVPVHLQDAEEGFRLAVGHAAIAAGLGRLGR